MGDKAYKFDNKRERKIHELYLNSKGADVSFVFKDADGDQSKKIPAHKIILSLDSPVFDRMFFGSIQEKGDVQIVDAPAAAFKEFLQFFYLNEVTLSSAHIIFVTNLCKKYETNEFLRPCETALQNSLSMDDMCWGYSIAQLLEQENLRKFCEDKIKTFAAKIIKSDSFMECDGQALSKIMTMVSSDWGVLERVIAYMEWSKAQCIRNNLDSNPTNLRNQLNDVFSEIPFGELSAQQLSQHVALYKGFFTAIELEELFAKQTLPKQPNPFDLQLLQPDLPNLPRNELVECDREKSGISNNKRCEMMHSTTIFSSNATLLLFEFNIYDLGREYSYDIFEGSEPTIFNKKLMEGESKICEIVLPKSIVIHAGKFYRVDVSCREQNGLKYRMNGLKNEMQLKHGIILKFSAKYEDKMTNLFFKTPDR